MVRFRLLCGDFFIAKSATNLENRMTVCMGYPAMTPKWESRKTPLEGGRKSTQGERHTQYQLVKIRGRATGVIFLRTSALSVTRHSYSVKISWSKWPTEKAGRAAGRNSCIPVSCIGVSFRKETAQEKLERMKLLIG